MRLTKVSAISIFVLIAIIALTSCSNSSKSQSPVEPGSQDYQASFGTDEGNGRDVVAVYDAVIDPDAGTFEITLSERAGSFHYPLTQMFPNVLQITGIGFTPALWVDIKLKHPYPGSSIAGFDPRVIAILPAVDPLWAINYPVFNVHANKGVILFPDGYTKMHDSLGGSIAGNANPYRSYFKSKPYRVWAPYTGWTEETQRWYMDKEGIEDCGYQFKLVVDVSTNYPNSPQPVVDNAKEPIPLKLEIGEGMTPDGGFAHVKATLLDWQGKSGIKCKVESPELFSGAIELFYSGSGPNPNEYTFEATIWNDLEANAGEYDVLLAAWDSTVGNHNFLEAKATVSANFNPIDLTPPYLNYQPWNIQVAGGYAYVAGGTSGLLIYNVSEISHPELIRVVDTPGEASDVQCSGGYAYVTDRAEGLQIIDVSPPEQAYIFDSIALPGYANDVFLYSIYAFVANDYYGLQIINMSTREIVKTVDTPGYAHDVGVSAGYAYVADWESGVQIIDINPVEDAFIAYTIDTPGFARGISVPGSWLFIADDSYGMHIYDVNDPLAPIFAKTVDTPGYAMGVSVPYGTGYGYIADNWAGVQVVEMYNPNNAQIVHTVPTPNSTDCVYALDNYAYMLDRCEGVKIIDINPPPEANILGSIDMIGNTYDVHVVGDYAYVADSYTFKIVDISNPETAFIVKTISTPSPALGVYMIDGYAYVGDYYSGLLVIDVEPPESAYVVTTVPTGDASFGVYCKDGWAYVADGGAGLQIVGIGSPEFAYVFKTVNTPGIARDVAVSNGYAYVADASSGMTIIDVDPPESAYIIKTLPTSDQSLGVDVYGDYAFTGSYIAGLTRFRISPPEDAYLDWYLPVSGYALGLDIEYGYVWITTGYGLDMVSDALSYSAPQIISSIDTPGWSQKVCVDGGYAYVASGEGGLRIIDPW